MRTKHTFFSRLVLVIGLALGSVAPLGASASSLPGLPGLQLAPLQSKAPLSFAFVDASLPDARQLQSAAAAASAAEPGAFHLFSHGRPGQLLINGQWLAAPEIAAWLRQSGLPEGTEQLNLYGCEFAQGEAGAQAVKTLEQLLGVSVAASTNLTGQGGDWVLEAGAPKAASLRVDDYPHSLQCTGPAGNCDGDTVLDLPDFEDDNDGILDTDEGLSYNILNPDLPRVPALWTRTSTTAATGTITQNGVTRTLAWTASTAQLQTAFTNDPRPDVTERNADFTITSSVPLYGLGLFLRSLTYTPTDSQVVVGNFRLTLSNGSVITLAAADYTVTSTIPAYFTLGAADLDLATKRDIGGVSYLGDPIANGGGSQGYGYVKLTSAIQAQIVAGGGVTQVRMTQIQLDNAASIRVWSFGFDATDASSLENGTSLDTDGDGIPDYKDLDSDNDGCYDAIEGGANFTTANIDVNGRLTGGVQANGVPTVAGAGQTVGRSRIATRLLASGTAPDNQTVTTVPSGTVNFTISAVATDTTSFLAGAPQYGSGTNVSASNVYAWYLGDPDAGGTLIPNGGVYSGATTATLSISNANNLIGNTYYVVVTNPTRNECAFIKEGAQLLSSVVDLAITKTNNLPGTVDLANDTLARGQSTTYQIVVTNNGPQSVTGAVVTDSATGLTCSGSVSCSATPAGACPAITPTAAQLLGAGVTLQALPVGGTATLNLACTVN